ncbi:MAG: xanthine dehydrogenase family protein subunit M [Acidobacteriota bacterium]|nr:MAG: xanthine dehydrogenase family protein subunit M [Acidobacteriota bacterium]
MYPASFDYYRPKNLKEAIALLRKNKDAKLLSGGHSLLPAMKLRVSSPSAVIDIGHLKGLDGIKASKSSVRIGGLTTHAAVVSSKDVQRICPVLGEAAALIGDLQVRNRGTIGGSLAHADPAADYPTLMLALGADITATGARGKRKIAADKFFVDLFTTDLKAGEVLTEVNVPSMKAGQGACYLKHAHPASSYAVVGVAAFVTVKNDVVKSVRLAIGGVTPTPILVSSVDRTLSGQSPSAKAVAVACESVPEALEFPLGDVYASGEYRTHLATVLSGRALTEAFERAKKQK